MAAVCIWYKEEQKGNKTGMNQDRVYENRRNSYQGNPMERPEPFFAAETPKKGIPVPLFNLVYHDCVIEPWMMDRVSKDEDYMLYALLAGGAPYLVRDGAYPNTDGAFDGEKISLEEMTERCRVVTELHEKTALLELVRHECMTADGSVQKSEFSDGTYVICDFAEQIYEIGYGA